MFSCHLKNHQLGPENTNPHAPRMKCLDTYTIKINRSYRQIYFRNPGSPPCSIKMYRLEIEILIKVIKGKNLDLPNIAGGDPELCYLDVPLEVRIKG